MWLSISRPTAYSPSAVSPRVVHCRCPDPPAALTGGAPLTDCGTPGSGAGGPTTSPCWACGHGPVLKGRPVCETCSVAMKVPLSPPSSAAPASALSVQCATNIVRTPILRSRAIPLSMSARVQFGCPWVSLQPNGFDDSRPISTASLPRSIARRAAPGALPGLVPPPAAARSVHGPDPAAAPPAALGIDVGLQRLQLPDLGLHGLRLVARVRLARLDVADRLVLHRLRDHQPLAGHPGTLEPAPVDLLVRVGVERRPAREARPAVRVVRPGGRAVAQQVAGDVEAAVRAVDVGVVAERLAHAEAVEVLA